jgi:hypothetical protein
MEKIYQIFKENGFIRVILIDKFVLKTSYMDLFHAMNFLVKYFYFIFRFISYMLLFRCDLTQFLFSTVCKLISSIMFQSLAALLPFSGCFLSCSLTVKMIL